MKTQEQSGKGQESLYRTNEETAESKARKSFKVPTVRHEADLVDGTASTHNFS